MNSTVKTVVFWVVIVLSAALLWTVIQNGRNSQKDVEVNFTQFMSNVDQGTVQEVTVDGMQVKGKKKDGSAFHTTAPHESRRLNPSPSAFRPSPGSARS